VQPQTWRPQPVLRLYSGAESRVKFDVHDAPFDVLAKGFRASTWSTVETSTLETALRSYIHEGLGYTWAITDEPVFRELLRFVAAPRD
jgi:hypothetical protein